MKSFKKGILALGLTLGIIASVGGGAFAYESTYGTVSGYGATGHSYCYATSGYSNTTYNRPGYLYVNSVYNYINIKTLSAGTKTQSTTSNNSTLAYQYVSAPNNCRSVDMYSTHVVSYGGQTWTGNTNAKR